MTLSAEQLELHDRMVSAMEEVQAGILALEPVRGIGVGLRKENGRLTDELAIIIYLRGDAGDLAHRLPTTIRDYPVAVQEADFQPQAVATEKRALAKADTKRYNPLLGGISMAPSRLEDGAGTLGLMVRGNYAHEEAMMLSNYHVMCLKDGLAQPGDEMCQEARSDNTIGWCGNCAELRRWFVGNVPIASKEYGVDAAVAVKTARDALISEVVSIGKLLGAGEPAVGMAVRKRGRTTELTSGRIQSISASIRESVGPPYGEVIMSNQITVVGDTGPFTAGGDSGSVYVNPAANKVVGLHWGSTTTDGDSVGNHISAVVAALNISIPSAPGDVVRAAEEPGPT
ncbi:S1 family peptidase [Nocardia sp. alder85J]|uniref:S1 family peptidase n=1 Tax=Nocardia sp. alder85J TaxID=2862949 RepID=UPI001CD5D885|nr:S1 family peptidase [Nocardia sp. alder85J]MCX4092952.1 S1 family peptidase [Nocardia sp. alder85J]